MKLLRDACTGAEKTCRPHSKNFISVFQTSLLHTYIKSTSTITHASDQSRLSQLSIQAEYVKSLSVTAHLYWFPRSGLARRGDEAQGGQVTHVLVDECFIQVWHILPLCVCRRPFAQLRGIISATQQECSGLFSAALWMSGPNSHNLGMGCQHMYNARHAISGTAVNDGAPQCAQGWNLFEPRQVENITAATLRLGIMSSFCSRRPSEQQENRDHQPWQCKFVAHQRPSCAACAPCALSNIHRCEMLLPGRSMQGRQAQQHLHKLLFNRPE